MIKRTFAIFILICAFDMTMAYPALLQSPKIVRLSEGSIRKLALKKVMPEFPEEARKEKAEGVAVTSIEIDEKGYVDQVEVLECPHPSIKKGLAEAVKQWEFKPSTLQGEPVRVRGKLTFYYAIKNGQARVENP